VTKPADSPSLPATLDQALRYFSDAETCMQFLVARRWPNGITCPVCGNAKVTFLKSQQRWQCTARHPKRQFSLKVGTIFEDSALGLDKWLAAVWLIANSQHQTSSMELQRVIGVTQKTAWFILHRVRLARQALGK
jgi:transposase-like protein